MASIFTQIIHGELPCYKIHEDELTFCFLALDQVNLGHTLVIPKQEVNHWMDVPERTYLRMAQVSQFVGKAIQQATDCPRVLTATVGFEVPHCHIHLIPAWNISDLSFAKALRRSEAEMKDIQKKIIGFIK